MRISGRKYSKRHNMDKMRVVQKKCEHWLYDEFCADFVYVKEHSRFSKDIDIHSAKFDGFCIKSSVVFFLQIKSRDFPKLEPYEKLHKQYGIKSILMRYKNGGEIEVKTIGGEK